jgi:hypothetical protein
VQDRRPGDDVLATTSDVLARRHGRSRRDSVWRAGVEFDPFRWEDAVPSRV